MKFAALGGACRTKARCRPCSGAAKLMIGVSRWDTALKDVTAPTKTIMKGLYGFAVLDLRSET